MAAPRMVRLNHNYSVEIQPKISILEGDFAATDKAKLFQYDILDECHVAHPQAPLEEFVDDLFHSAAGESSVVLSVLPRSAALLADLFSKGRINLYGALVWTSRSII